jgi:hypothetical protein
VRKSFIRELQRRLEEQDQNTGGSVGGGEEAVVTEVRAGGYCSPRQSSDVL